MMKVVIITPTPPDISAFGVRSLSAFLRSKGRDTRLVFLPGSIGLLAEEGRFVYSYPRQVLDQLPDLCREADLVGVSFMTNYFDRAIQITEHLRDRISAPIIWGGIHPSTRPEEALRYADMVCIGEGEETLLEILDRLEAGKDCRSVAGMWFRENGETVKNPLRPLIRDLDSLPHFDFSNEDHFILNKETDRVEALTDEFFKKTLPLLNGADGRLKRVFRIMTDRGCPHRCAYCNVSTLKEMYRGDKSPYLRARSVENFVEELARIRDRFPFVEIIQFFDDTFFARSTEQLERFSELYKAGVGIPFVCQASPNTLTERKLRALLDAGLIYVEMGIQTGSERIRKLYRRNETNSRILEATKLLHAYRDRLITPDYHVIIDNPWETDEDVLDTARLLQEVPKPYGLCISSLVFFPGTELHDKAVAEGFIKDEVTDVYRKPFYIPPKRTYANFLIYLFTFQHIPKRFTAFLLRDRIVKRFSGKRLSLFYKVAYRLGEGYRLISKGFQAAACGDWERIAMYFRGLKLNDPAVEGRKK